MATKKQLTADAYTVVLIYVKPIEMHAITVMLDEIHQSFPMRLKDDNEYTLGKIGNHNVAITGPPKGGQGKVVIADVVGRIRLTFKNIVVGLLVGIGGGVPHLPEKDVRLGDVVVGAPEAGPAVVQYDLGKQLTNKIECTRTLNKPPPLLLKVVDKVEDAYQRAEDGEADFFTTHLQRFEKYQRMKEQYRRPAVRDRLFLANYEHKDGTDCNWHNSYFEVRRQERTLPGEVRVHYSTILSGDLVMKSGEKRDQISKEFYNALCFEMEAAGLMDVFPCLIIRGICDYSDSHKNEDWQPYAAATAASYAREILLSMAERTVEELKDMPNDAQKRQQEIYYERFNCHQTLRTSEYEDHKARNPDRVDGTCRWFLTHQKFLAWQESKMSGLLWVSADPGCGKSVLSKSLIDNELRSNESRTICYFFFKDDNDTQKSELHALCALLHQLFSQKRELIRHALPTFGEEGTKLPQLFSKLWGILINAAADYDAGEIICVLDALDECEDLGRYKLIDTLKDFYRKTLGYTGRNTALKFLVTSRPYFDIERRFRELTNNLPTIRLAGEDETASISREIDLVIKAKVNRIGSDLCLEDSVRSSLEKHLLTVTHRTYLWLKLIFEVIYHRLDVTTEKRLHKIISTIPNTVEKAYEAILERSTDIKEAKKLLHIVVSAIRPLTLQEMKVALAIEEGSGSYKDLDLESEESFRTTVRNLCGLFVSVVDSKIYLIHQTAKEFLVGRQVTAQPASSITTPEIVWKHSLSPVESNLVLAKICISYLLFAEFERYPLRLDKSWLTPMGQVEKYTNLHHFLGYAARYWTIHFRAAAAYFPAAKIKEGTTMSKAACDVCDTRSNRFLTWLQVCWTTFDNDSQFPQNFADLVANLYFRHPTLVHILLEKGSGFDVNSKDQFGRTAALWAAANGCESLLVLLMKRGVKPESKDKYGKTLLLLAARNGETEVVELLLEKPINPNSKDTVYGRTPLSWAAGNGHRTVVRLLLQKGVNVDSKDYSGQTPLLWAAEQGHHEVVKLLLDYSVDLDSKDTIYGRTPLSWAAGNGHEAVVRLLLTRAVDKNSKDKRDQTPLARAMVKRHKAIVELLRWS